ncbi:MAG: NAD(P)/FAD-dependent oxidoreductase [Candidatus Promineifilaceae bacterium]
MNKSFHRLSLGLLIGLIVAGLELILVRASSGMRTDVVTLNDLGGAVRLLAAGGLLGAAFSLLFRPLPNGQADNIMSGFVLGIIAWVILAVNIFPLSQANTPMWDVQFTGSIFPKLVAYVVQGMLVGLLYGLVYERFGPATAVSEPPTPQAQTNVVIIGGGYAGVSAAQALDEAFAHDPETAVWLVSETNYLVHTPMLSEVSASAVNAQNISPPLRSFFKRVYVVQGQVAQVDWEAGQVTLTPNKRSSRRQIPFDHLVMTAGSVPNYFGNEKIETYTLTFKTLNDSMRLRNRVIDLFERADFETDPVRKRQMLTFVVIGGGFAGVELIGGLNDFGRGMLPHYPNLKQEDLRFVLIHTREVILPELSPELGLFAQEKMAARGVEFILNMRVTDAQSGKCLMGEDEIASDTMVWTAGNRPSPIIAKLGVNVTRRGQIPVAATMQSVERPNLWAAGDCAQIPDPNNDGKFYPPTAQHALREGKLLGKNVAAAIGGERLKPFSFKTLGSLAALGHQLAVAEFFGYRFSGFLAWLMWRGIYLSKLPSFEKQLRVLFDWVLDIFFPPDIVQTISFDEPEEEEIKA